MYRLLVVDDEPRDRNIVKILVEKQYPDLFEILEAKSGTQALELMRRETIDLLLLDLNMPGLSGIEVIRELPASVYVIILTAYSFFDYAREALHYGVKDYVLKPPIRAELYSAIDRFLQERRSQPDDQKQGKKVLFRELATQILFYGNVRKIEEYYSLLGLRGSRIALAVLLMEERSAAEHLEDAVQQLLQDSTVRYAAAGFREGVAVLFFWKTPEERAAVQNALPLLERSLGGTLQFEPELSSCSEVPQVFVRLCDQDHAEWKSLDAVTQAERLESALREQDFSAAMQCVTEELDRWDYRTHSDEAKFQLITTLSNSTKNLFANADKRGAYGKLSALLGAADKEQLMNSTAEYLHWLIGEIQKSVYTNSYVVHRVIDAVKLDCARSWTMEGLAADLKISPYYLSHLFKEYTGSSFTDYLTECRIEQAVELMKRSELSLAQIGDMVGYADQNYFSRVFKKRRGIGARQFRKQLLSE